MFISGGSKSGKSMHAQLLAKKMRKPDKPLYYLATMIPADDEDQSRIERHRSEREGWGFITVEAGNDLPLAIRNCDNSGVFLLDSITALLANEMFTKEGHFQESACKKVTDDLTGIICKVDNLAIVSDSINSDAFIYDSLTETFRRSLAEISRIVARICDVVIEVSAGIPIIHKGGELYHGLD